MKKLSNINETSWGGMVRRSSSSVVRKEDELEWIDLGPEFDCLWLNGIYEKEGKTRFKWSEVKEIVRSMPDLRLPKFEEVKKLHVELYKGTLYIEGTENHLDPIKDWKIWNDRGGVIVLGINTAKIRLSLIDDEYPFILVKPKAINETSWGGMVRRSNPEKQVREEDDVKMEYFPKTRNELKSILWGIDRSLVNSKVMDVRNIDVSNMEDLSNSFEDFENIEYIDVRGWNTSNCTNMNSMFSGCENLKEIIGIENWDVSNVNKMEDVFYKCEKLKTLDISKWNVRNVETMIYMFDCCIELQSLDLGKWNTSSLKNTNGMFFGCKKLETLDVSGWNVRNLENTDNMFAGCENLKVLDVKNWRPVELIDMNGMFAWCKKLEELDLSGWKLKYQTTAEGMFKGCPEKVKWVFDKDHFYKTIVETSWGGMVRRSSSDVVRKENWLNGLGRCEFYDHLKKTYDIRYGRNIILSRDVESILVPITGQRAPMYLHLDYENDKLMEIYYYSSNKSLAVTLSDTFDVRYSRNNIINITASNGDVNNEVAIDVIDTLSNIVTSPATVRKNELNETSWGGMVRRSSGGVVRKQDELDDETRKCLDDYIEWFSSLCSGGYDIFKPTLDNLMNYIRNGKGEGGKQKDEYRDILLKYIPRNWDKGENIEKKILDTIK